MSSFQWSPLMSGGGGVATYANLAAFPSASSAGNGSLAIALDTNILYESNGTSWIAIAGPGAALSIGSPANGLSIAANVLTLGLSSTSTIGALNNTDWNTFNNKQNSLTFGNLTDAGTDGIIVTGGAGSVIGSGTSIAQTKSDATHNGYLSSGDWSTFNGKQAAGNYITALTGDGTAAGPGSAAFTLATVNSNVGSFTNASITVNAKGLITAASSGSTAVTAVSIATANGFAGSSSGGTTPALTLTTTLNTPVIAGNGTAIIAATTTGSGSTVVLATAPTMTNPVVGTQSQGDSSTKAASTSYVDTAVANAIAGVNPAVAVQAASTANLSGYTYLNGASGIGATLTAGSNNVALTVDGYTFTAIGQRLLAKDQSSGFQNGIYYVTQVQTSILPVILTRALDYDTPSDINNTGAIPVVNGTVNGTTSWVQTAQITTVGTDSLVFVKFTRNPADYLLVANNLSDVASKSTSFNNLSPMTTLGDITYEDATPTGVRLAGNTTSTKKFLTQTGNGSISAAPGWNTIVAGDVPTLNQNTTGSAATLTTARNINGVAFDGSTNITVTAAAGTLTGTTLNSTVVSSSLTSVGTIATGVWNGTTIAIANGGTGQTAKTAAFDALQPMTTGGDIIYGGASGTGTRLANGSSGQVLTSAGGTSAPSWSTPGNITVVSKTTTYSIVSTDGLILCSGSAFTVTLPTAVSASGETHRIKKTDSSLTNIITINTTSAQTIDGAASTTLNTQYEDITVVSDGANWQLLDRHIDATWFTTSSIAGATSGFGTVTSVNYRSRRVGDSLEVVGNFTCGTVANSQAQIGTYFNGTAVTVDTSKNPTATVIGNAGNNSNSTTFFGEYIITPGSNQTYVNVSVQQSTSNITSPANGNALSSTSGLMVFKFTVPINGWSSN